MTNHAIEQAKQRYGVDLTFDDLRAIRKKIKNGKAILQTRRQDCSTYLVEHLGKIMVPRIMDNGTIVTFVKTGDGQRAKWRNSTHQKIGNQHSYDKKHYRRDHSWRSEIDT